MACSAMASMAGFDASTSSRVTLNSPTALAGVTVTVVAVIVPSVGFVPSVPVPDRPVAVENLGTLNGVASVITPREMASMMGRPWNSCGT